MSLDLVHKLFTYERVARLSFPYPSKRLTIPQIPRPAPSAITSVCNTPTAELKNPIVSSFLPPLRLNINFSYFLIKNPLSLADRKRTSGARALYTAVLYIKLFPPSFILPLISPNRFRSSQRLHFSLRQRGGA